MNEPAEQHPIKLRRAPALALLNLPQGLALHAPALTDVLDAEVLAQPGLLGVLERCDDWRERSELERQLGEAGFDPATAARALDELVEARLLVSSGDAQAVQRQAHAERWEQRGWQTAFEYHAHVGAIPRMDYRDDDAIKNDVEIMKGFVAAEPPPDNYKELAGRPFIALSPVDPHAPRGRGRSLEALLAQRPADFADAGPLSASDFSWLTWLAFGQTARKSLPVTQAHVARTSPSGGARHPTEVYPIVFDVEGVAQGLYHYSVKRHGLELLAPGDHRALVREHLLMLPDRATWRHRVVYLCTSIFERSMFRYRDSFSYRVVHHDVGHLLQTTALLAGDLGRNCYRSYTLHHAPVERCLGIDGVSEAAIAFAVIG
ncbi:MAG: SagB/ThcOx family dehydrogenase [Archangiaceae bacterium]|nr:SagB/ThcOx family dehydrogenase [Archangiaceae bacterium]